MHVRNYLQIYKRFQNIDRQIMQRLSRLPQHGFAQLWITQKDYAKHLKKRLRRGEVKNSQDYMQKTLATLCFPSHIYYLQARTPKMRDKIFYVGNGWVSIFLSNAKMITSFPLRISLAELLSDRKNSAYLQVPIDLSLHNPKKVIICQKKESHATDHAP